MAIKTISIDIETFSSVDLAKSGVYPYAESADFEILLFGYTADGMAVEVVDLSAGEQIPSEIITALMDDSVMKWAFNATFERVCLSIWLRRNGFTSDKYLDSASWRCSMIWSAYMGLPLSLAGVGAVLGLEKQKMKDGKELIRYFCNPCKATKSNGGRTRNLPEHAPEKWTIFKAYNKRDIEVEQNIQARLGKYPVPESVWAEYHMDQRINDRGVGIDLELVRQAIKLDEQSKSRLLTTLKEITGLENPNSVLQMKAWLEGKGLVIDSLEKKALSGLLKTAPEELKNVLLLRQQLAKSSVKKYQAMRNAACQDKRARGMFQFYGANRSGRWAGRLIQLQNLPQNHMPDLDAARELVRTGDFAALDLLYDSVPDVLSELIRTAFVPRADKFVVADFSSIEARVLAWLAGEQWVLNVFADNGDIYCATAAKMFHCNVVKHGENGELRQKGKQCELACIAAGQRVLTDQGLVPIEQVTTTHRLWDGEHWVNHDGVIYKGEREVITYEELTATTDHLVWIAGESQPIPFGLAASSGAHLIQTGYGGQAVRLGENYLSRETMEQENESLLCADAMHGLWQYTMAVSDKPAKRQIKGMPELFPTKADPTLVRQETYGRKAPLREPKRQRLSQLWWKRHKVCFSKCDRSRTLSNKKIWIANASNGTRQDRQQWRLCQRQYSFCNTCPEQRQQKKYGAFKIFSGILALRKKCGHSEIVSRNDSGRNHTGCGEGRIREAKKLEDYRSKARLYDIRNAGKHHRFTVSGKLVHNCGYGGSVGALKAFGALDAGMREEELQPLVDAWRAANPQIVRFWWDIDRAAKKAVKEKMTTETHGIRFVCQSGMLFIRLLSGRSLCYVKPRMGENKFGGESITYEGVGTTKKWERIESYGPKFVENIVQATARDILCYAIKNLQEYRIVAHVHDELIIECEKEVSVDAICEQMSRTPPWAKGLQLRADGYQTMFYKKD